MKSLSTHITESFVNENVSVNMKVKKVTLNSSKDTARVWFDDNYFFEYSESQKKGKWFQKRGDSTYLADELSNELKSKHYQEFKKLAIKELS